MSNVIITVRYRLIWSDERVTYLDSPNVVTTKAEQSANARAGKPYVARIERIGIVY